MNSEPLKSFLETGEKPRSQKQISALLDQSRNQILSNPTNTMTYFHNGQAYTDAASYEDARYATRHAKDDPETLLDKLTNEHREKNGLSPAPHKRNPAARPAAPAASKPTVHRATAATARPAPSPAKPQLTGLARTAAAFAASSKPAAPRPNRPSTRPLTGLEKTIQAFQKTSAIK